MARKRTAKKKASGSGRGEQRGKLARIGALWVKTGKNGKYLAGTIDIDNRNSVKLMVFPNGYKEQDRHPDYVIYAPPADDGSTDERGNPMPEITEATLPGMDGIGAQSREPGDESDDEPFI